MCSKLHKVGFLLLLFAFFSFLFLRLDGTAVSPVALVVNEPGVVQDVGQVGEMAHQKKCRCYLVGIGGLEEVNVVASVVAPGGGFEDGGIHGWHCHVEEEVHVRQLVAGGALLWWLLPESFQDVGVCGDFPALFCWGWPNWSESTTIFFLTAAN